MKRNKNISHQILGLMIGIGIMFGICFCDSPKKEGSISSGNPDFNRAERELDSVSIQMDTAWHILVASDEKKLANMRTIIDEYRLYLPQGADSMIVDTLYKSLDALPALRPNRENMAKPDVIDKFDQATTTVIENLRKTREKYADLQKYQRIQLFMDDIQAADDSVIFYRRDYDVQADVFNRIIERNQNVLETHSEKYKQQKRLPIFRLIP